MVSDLLSLADASGLLGVSSERVRQLVRAGDLPGVRFGNAWAVPREAVSARRHAANRRGRPLGARRAWEVIAGGDVELSNVSKYRNRAEVRRFAISGNDFDYVIEQRHVLQSGVAGAIAHGQPLQRQPGEGDVYITLSLMENLHRSVALVPDNLGPVAFRVVPDDLWDFVNEQSVGRMAPAAAVALDLMEVGDPRSWVAAEQLVASQ